MGKLIVAFLLLVALPVSAGEVMLSWKNPTKSEVCTDAGAADIDGIRIWQLVTEVDENDPTEYVIDRLLPGEYVYAASAFNTSGTESRMTGTVTKTVSDFVAEAGSTVYQVVSIENGFWLLPVGTIETEVACNTDQSVNGRYAVPLSAVNLTGTTDPVVVVADCV